MIKENPSGKGKSHPYGSNPTWGGGRSPLGIADYNPDKDFREILTGKILDFEAKHRNPRPEHLGLGFPEIMFGYSGQIVVIETSYNSNSGKYEPKEITFIGNKGRKLSFS